MKSIPLSVKFLHEFHRYSDVLGFGMLHGHGLASIPVRLPVPLVFLFATYVLWRYRRTWFYLELTLLLPAMLWLIYTANKSSRYVVILAPVFAFAIAAAVAALREHPRMRRTMLALAALVVAAQAGANFYLLHAARQADYNKVHAELESVIPPGQTAYGTITFWMALRDHPYVSYERTTPAQAAADFHARYFILGDRMMMNGSDWEGEYYRNLFRQLTDLTATGQLVGDFPDPYYGDLRVYRIPD